MGRQFDGSLTGVERAQHLHDGGREDCGGQRGTDDDFCAARFTLGDRDVDFRTGVLFGAGFMHIIDDANNAGFAVADAASEFANGVFIWPFTTGSGLIDDNHVLGFGRVVPGEVAAFMQIECPWPGDSRG